MNSHRLVEFAQLDSTNLYARANLRWLHDRDVVQADVQTAGRGRGQRSWISHFPGNLCLTCVLKPDTRELGRLPLVNVSQLLALCACRVLDAYHARSQLKWPNDILINGHKIAGILAETVTEGAEFLGLIVGIGVNLNLDPATLAEVGQPATALNLLTGHPTKVAGFRDALLAEFFGSYDRFLAQGFSLIREEYLGRFAFCGRAVVVKMGDSTVAGTVRAINAEGALELVESDGTLRVIHLGEMFPAAS